MDILDELLMPSRRGRPPGASAALIRELTEEDDLAVAEVATDNGVRALTRIRQTHHAMARLIAEGRANTEVAAITGYTPQRVMVLKQDPMFSELVAYYAAQKDEIYLDVHQRLATLGMDAVEELRERLHDKPESMSTRELIELTELTLDRSVTATKGPAARSAGGGSGAALVVNFISPSIPAGSLSEGSQSPTITIEHSHADPDQ